MFCARCGTQNAEGSSTCPSCGGPLSAAMPGAVPNSATMIRGPEMGFAPPRTSGLAIASLVLSFFGITALPGLICGILALRQIDRNKPQVTGQGLAIAGIVISGMSLVLVPILAAILLPVFAAARDSARTTSCESNLKQIALGTVMYSQDYDEKFPLTGTWTSATYPYIKNQSVYHCPADPSPLSAQSYAYNAQLNALSMAKIKDPPNLVMQFDSHSGTNMAGGSELLEFRHHGGDRANVSFVDGHVTTVPLSATQEMLFNPRISSAGSSMPGAVSYTR